MGSFISVCGLFTLDFMPGTILRLRYLGALVDDAGLIWLGRYLAPYPFPPPSRRAGCEYRNPEEDLASRPDENYIPFDRLLRQEFFSPISNAGRYSRLILGFVDIIALTLPCHESTRRPKVSTALGQIRLCGSHSRERQR